MDKLTFIKIMNKYQIFAERVYKYDDFGVNVIDTPYCLVTPVEEIIDDIFKMVFNDLGVDWIHWFMYENDFGKNNLQAFDDDNDDKLICQTIEDLYDYIEKYKI